MPRYKKDSIAELERLANQIYTLKEEYRQRRPIVIEICGCPKSGKTSCINTLNIFLKRNGFKTSVLTERASVCPVPNKHDPFFNIWTSNASIAELINKLSQSHDTIDFIIADRGLLDSLCWFEWLRSKNYLDREDHEIIQNYLTMRQLRKYVDLVYVFISDSTISMEREYATLLTRKTGSIMNTKILNEYIEAINITIKKHGSKFKKIEKIDTSKISQNKVSEKVTRTILMALKDLLVEKIGYFKIPMKSFSHGIHQVENVIRTQELKFHDRDTIEDGNFIQPVPIAVLTNKEKNKVFVIKKQEKSISKHSPEKDKTLIYAGGHIRKEDVMEYEKDDLIKVMKNCLQRELREELGINLIPKDPTPFLIYTPVNEISARHIAVCFVEHVDFDNLKFRLDQREIVQKKGLTKSGRVMELSQIIKENKLEPWTITILDYVFGRTIQKQYQITID